MTRRRSAAPRGGPLGLRHQRRDDRGRRRAGRPRIVAARRSLPRFEPHGRDVGVALGIEEGPSNDEVAAEVEAQRASTRARPSAPATASAATRDVAAQWASSAHRFSSFNNPYYRVATDAFRDEKGAVASRFCGNCHEPFLVATGAMDRPGDRSRHARGAGGRHLPGLPLDRARRSRGQRPLRGRPAPVPTAKGAHGARLRPALMAQAQFCAACHKVGLGADVTAGERWLRGQNDYDAWHVSAVVGQRRGARCIGPTATQALPGLPHAARAGACRATRARRTAWSARTGSWARTPRCRTCAATPSRSGARASNLRGRASLALLWSGAARVDALMRARGVGHRFPGGTMDSNEVWLEVTALDAAGQVIAVRAARGRDGALDADAHLVRAQPVDGDGAPARAARSAAHARRRLRRGADAVGPAGGALRGAEGHRPRRGAASLPQVLRRLRGVRLRRPSGERPARAAWTCRSWRSPPPRSRRARRAPTIRRRWSTGARARGRDRGSRRGGARAARRPRARRGRRASSRCSAWRGWRTGSGRPTTSSATPRRRCARVARSPGARWRWRRARCSTPTASARRVPSRNGWRGGCPAIAVALGLLARARGLTGDAAGALAAADGLLAIDPESEEGFYQRALALGELGPRPTTPNARRRATTVPRPLETDLALRDGWRRRTPATPTNPSRATRTG